MIAGLTWYQICWYFLIYSFIGWCVEVIYHAVTVGQVINRGFLNGPVCPVYGFGSLAVFAAGNCISGSSVESLSFWPLFAMGVLLATSIELLAGWLLDILFHARWWDYSNKPLNFHGYICLEFSLIWGLGIVFIVRIMYPSIDRLSAGSIDPRIGWPVLAAIYAVYLLDLIVTVAIVRGMNQQLEQLDKVRSDLRIVSDKLSTVLADETIRTANVIQEGQVQAALGRAELKEAAGTKRRELETAAARRKAALQTEAAQTRTQLEKRLAALQQQKEELAASLTGNPYFGTGRILRAFPDLRHRSHHELISRLRQRISGENNSSRQEGH